MQHRFLAGSIRVEGYLATEPYNTVEIWQTGFFPGRWKLHCLPGFPVSLRRTPPAGACAARIILFPPRGHSALKVTGAFRASSSQARNLVNDALEIGKRVERFHARPRFCDRAAPRGMD